MVGTKFVIDASILAAYVLDDEESATADTVIESLNLCEAIAPSFLFLEISNVLLLAERRCRITPGDRPQLIKVIKELKIIEEAYSQERVFSRVLPIAAYHGLSIYDATYLELATRLSIPLATLDNKLRAAALVQGVSIFEGQTL